MSIHTKILCTLFATACAASAQATDLSQVYQQAVRNDKTFAAAQAKYYADREDQPLARAAILPQFNVVGTYTHNTASSEAAAAPHLQAHNAFNEATYTLSLTDDLLNLQSWQSIAAASSTVKASLATYNEAIQNLIVRTTEAYFNLLSSVDKLRWDVALEQSYLQQLQINKEKFRVGLVAITPVYNAQAAYDTQRATVITDRTTLANNMEALRLITGHTYRHIKTLRTNLPLLTPRPNNINDWVALALRQNNTLRSQRYTAYAAMQNIRVQAAARLPSLGLTANYTPTYYSGVSNRLMQPNRRLTASAVGLSLNVPLFQGGAVFANTRQARYQYDAASAARDNQQRLTVQSTRDDFLSVVAGISTIKADRISIQSSQKSLETNIASWKVGTRTILEVLQSYASLYQVQTQNSADQYAYLLSTIKLKDDAGILGPQDIARINRLMTQNVTFIPQKAGDYRVLYNNRSLKATYAGLQKNQDSAPPSTPNGTPPSAAAALHYTVVLYQAHTRHSADLFIHNRSKTLRPHLHVRTLQQDGKTLYQVTYGRYAHRASAQRALKQHPRWKRFKPSVQALKKDHDAATQSKASAEAPKPSTTDTKPSTTGAQPNPGDTTPSKATLPTPDAPSPGPEDKATAPDTDSTPSAPPAGDVSSISALPQPASSNTEPLSKPATPPSAASSQPASAPITDALPSTPPQNTGMNGSSTPPAPQQGTEMNGPSTPPAPQQNTEMNGPNTPPAPQQGTAATSTDPANLQAGTPPPAQSNNMAALPEPAQQASPFPQPAPQATPPNPQQTTGAATQATPTAAQDTTPPGT